MATLRNTQELETVIADLTGATFVTIESATDPRMVKKHRETGEPNPYLGAVKVSRVNGIVNWIYSNSVNNQRVREDKVNDFVPESRKWGERRLLASGNISPFVDHKTNVYLELKVERSLGYHYEMPDGTIVPNQNIEPYLPARRPTRQGLDKEVILRDYRLDSITSITVNRERYEMA